MFIIMLGTFVIYMLIRKDSRNSENQQSLSKTDLNPYFDGLNFDIEEKVRKQWLISFFLFIGMTFVSIFFEGFGVGAFNGFFENTNLDFSDFSVISSLIFSCLNLLLWGWITYYCAYKKRGTGWLMWIMITLPLRELVRIGKGELNQVALWDSFTWFLVVTYLCVEVFYWINCLRLRKINAYI